MFQNNLEITQQFIKTSFKLKYRNSILGVVWVIIKPLTMFLVQWFFFTKVILIDKGNQIEFFAIKLMLGTIIWSFIIEGITMGMNSVLEKAGIILKVNFDRTTAVVSAIGMAFVNLCINFIVFAVIYTIYMASTPDFVDHMIKFAIGLIPSIFVIFILILNLLGITLLLSPLNVKVRDLQSIIEVILNLGVWLTPVNIMVPFAKNQALSSGDWSYYNILVNNPIGWAIDACREILIYNDFTNSVPKVGLLLISGIILLSIGYMQFNKNIKRIAEYM